MDLILWRHADAGEPCADPQQDLLRPLSPKGERQATRMAQWINRQLIDSARVLVSPAMRAQQTAKALDRTFKTVHSLGPDHDADALLLACQFQQRRDTVLVVGHQPTLGQVVARLLLPTHHPVLMWSIRKGSICWLKRRGREGQERVSIHAMLGPDNL